MQNITQWLDWDKYYYLQWEDLQSWISWFWQTKEDAFINFLKNLVDKNHNPSFDYWYDHWENWNYDDSFEYWVSCWINDTWAELRIILWKI